jgi:hypothetical protein
MSFLRALGGGELVGSSFLRSVYVDEAGISNNGHERTVVVAGVILYPDMQWRALEAHFQELKVQFVPLDKREDFVFHAKDIWHGEGKVFGRDVYVGDRREVLRALCSTITKFELGVVYGHVSKQVIADSLDAASLPISPKTVVQICYMAALADALGRANAWVGRYAKDEFVSVVIENNNELKRFGQRMFKELRSNTLSPEIRKVMPQLPFPHIMDVPSFMFKEDAPVLQLADFCAFILRRFLDGHEDAAEYLRPLMPLMMASVYSEADFAELAARSRS